VKLQTLIFVNMVAVALVTAAGAGADVITLTDRNSTVVFDTTSSTLQKRWTIISALSNTTPTTLNDDPGPATGDASWAFQWDFDLAAGQEAPAISKVQRLEAPEPARSS
jgi:hypothetical protein